MKNKQNDLNKNNQQIDISKAMHPKAQPQDKFLEYLVNFFKNYRPGIEYQGYAKWAHKFSKDFTQKNDNNKKDQ